MDEQTFGHRVQRARERAGKTRAVVGGLCDRSEEWVKGIEKGRIGVPRLPLLLRLAEVLGVEDLVELTGEARLTPSSYAKASHGALDTVTTALMSYEVDGDTDPVPAVELTRRLGDAWALWHGAARHRTAVATVLPSLLADARRSARLLDGSDRRTVARVLAGVYHLAQLYLSFQPVPELVMVTGDRAMLAAQDADDPKAIAVASWYLNHVFRDAGQRHEARVDLAHRTMALLRPEAGREDLARWGLLQLACALSFAKVGQSGSAWRHWDEASRAADTLGDGYVHPWLIFGRGMVDAYAVTMYADLYQPGEAVRAANRLDLDAMPSATRRSFHLTEVARAYALRADPLAAAALIRSAYDVSSETVRFNLFSHRAIVEMSASRAPLVRSSGQALASLVGSLRG